MDNYRVIYSSPYDARVEYLSNGYIDTGIYANKNTKIELGFHINSFGTASGGIIGVHTSESGHKSFAVLLRRVGTSGSYTGALAYDNFTYKGNSTNIAFDELYVYHTLIYQDGLLKCDNDEEEVQFGDNQTLDTMFLMRSNGSSFSCPIAIYYCKIWDNSTLVRDFIPVRIGQVGYFYDKVSKQLFANQGTGNFVLGQDVSNPVPNIRCVLYDNNQRCVLTPPYESKVEYIESTGTQYIDTGIIVNSSDSISVILQFTNLSVPTCIFSARTFGNSKKTISLFRQSYNSLRFDYGKTQHSQNVSISNYSTTHEYKSVANKLYVDGVLKATNTTDSFTSGSSVMILASPHPSQAAIINNFASAKLYSVKIVNSNNEILCDLIPVRIGTKGYMYDKITGKLFGNQGTGSFILGNDIN